MFDITNLTDEFFVALNPEEVLEIKELTTDEKIECFKFFLTSEVITNVSVISNLYLLIDGISNIDEDMDNDERIFFNSLEEYVDIVVSCIEILPPNVVIHRLTGDGDKNTLIEPKWSLNKKVVLNSINKEFINRDTFQGKFLKY